MLPYRKWNRKRIGEPVCLVSLDKIFMFISVILYIVFLLCSIKTFPDFQVIRGLILAPVFYAVPPLEQIHTQVLKVYV